MRGEAVNMLAPVRKHYPLPAGAACQWSRSARLRYALAAPYPVLVPCAATKTKRSSGILPGFFVKVCAEEGQPKRTAARASPTYLYVCPIEPRRSGHSHLACASIAAAARWSWLWPGAPRLPPWLRLSSCIRFSFWLD